MANQNTRGEALDSARDFDVPTRLESAHAIKLAEIRANARKWELVFGTIKYAIGCTTVVGCIYILMRGLMPWASQSPAAIEALAKVMNAINVQNITGYILAAAAGAAWFLERNGKKRAIKEKAHYQLLAESNDSYRSSSGLTLTGDTPRAEP